jgi:DNA-binding GntR family transcriptional regulator
MGYTFLTVWIDRAASTIRSMDKVDQFSPVLLHVQLTAILRCAIEAGELAPRAKLPSEAELMTEHGVSRGTVRMALAKLRSDGLVVTLDARGTFVNEQHASPPDE